MNYETIIFPQFKKCSNPKCRRKNLLLYTQENFHKTFRKYETSAGLIKTYYYYHSKCKECRNKEKREYNKRRKKND